MSEDPDFPKANHALQVLRQARLSRNETPAIMAGDLVYEMASTGLRTPEIEEAREAAWVAISALASETVGSGSVGPLQQHLRVFHEARDAECAPVLPEAVRLHARGSESQRLRCSDRHRSFFDGHHAGPATCRGSSSIRPP
jgi:hypothetical protein